MKYQKYFKSYTELDDRAWDIFMLIPLSKNAGYTFKEDFVHYRYTLPYSQYYEQAKHQLRRDKLNKIMNNV